MNQLHPGGVTAPKGFSATSLHCGVKRKKKDLALLYSEQPLAVAGVFTTNQVQAAPVILGKSMLQENSPIHGVIVNSGNANACTGDRGMEDAKMVIHEISKATGYTNPAFLMGSTGVIGVPLPMNPILSHIDQLIQSLESDQQGGTDFAEGIMTTDTFKKEIATKVNIGGVTVTIGGAAKGSGMIHPNMATMLAYVTTDASISQKTLQLALDRDVKDTYNMISVDGDTSTNDTLLVMANGAAQGSEIMPNTPEFELFMEALHRVNLYLAQSIVRDGEGASKFLTFTVKGAKTKDDARTIARSAVTSNLSKTALFGEDANWGRFLCAMGYAGVQFNPNKVALSLSSSQGTLTLLDKGNPLSFSEEKAKIILQERDIYIEATLKEGDEEATAYGCDLSYEYVKINGDYRS